MNTETPNKPGLLLIAGAVLGAALAASGILESPGPTLGKDLVASVNGKHISKTEYLGYLDLLARDKRNPMTGADRRHVLERIIEEKLLLDRGLGIDLPYSDPKVRKAIVNAMIQTIISDVSSAEPDPELLREFYQQNQQYFASPGQIQVQRMVFRGAEARQRAAAAHARLGAEAWGSVAATMADKDILSLPGSLLPISKLRGYIGPSLTDLALNLPVGGFSAPQPDQAGFTIVKLLALQHSETPALEKIREQVLREFQRRAGDDALRDYLEELREAADISIDEQFLQQLDQLEPASG